MAPSPRSLISRLPPWRPGSWVETLPAAGAVPATPNNPFGVSGPLTAEGRPNQSSYQIDETREDGFGSSLASKFWRGKIDVLLSYRRETAEKERLTTNELKGPITYDSKAYGVVVDTPIKGLRAYANQSRNSKINFATDLELAFLEALGRTERLTNAQVLDLPP